MPSGAAPAPLAQWARAPGPSAAGAQGHCGHSAPQWREMVQGFVFAFPSMAWQAVSKAQETTCFLAVGGWGVWVEKNVKALRQLLREAARRLVNACLGSEPANSKGTQGSPPEFTSPDSRFSLSHCFRSKMLLLQVKK